MKERPILFSAPMVRALLAGTKTQTRRAIKGLTDKMWIDESEPGKFEVCYDGAPCCGDGSWDVPQHRSPLVRRFGVPGDRLWVRETLTLNRHAGARGGWLYSADNAQVSLPAGDPRIGEMYAWAHHKRVDACPSIHMPRWASRITLEVTEVRVERLPSISEEDALAEGIAPLNGRFTFNEGVHESRSAVESYRALWESINGPRSWEASTWVWAISFRRI